MPEEQSLWLRSEVSPDNLPGGKDNANADALSRYPHLPPLFHCHFHVLGLPIQILMLLKF